MTQSNACRKRCRSNCDEESSEFAPLSKRINNLHINNTLLNTGSTTADSRHHNGCQDNVNIYNNHQHLHHQSLGVDTVDTSQWNGIVNDISSELSIINHNISHQRDTNGVGNGNNTHMQQQISRHLQEANLPLYNPDLTPSENPYYYENNRLLYTLYMERLQRNNSNQL